MTARVLGGLLFALVLTPCAMAQDRPAAPPAPKPADPPYPTAHEKPLKPKEDVVRTSEGHTQYRVEFNGVRGDRVPAYLYVPRRKDGAAAAKRSLPAILLQYGSGGNKGVNYIVAIGKQFADRGYVVLTIDSPFCGERRTKGARRPGGALGLLSTDQVMHYCGDYSRAVDFLAARPEVNTKRLGFVGISWGAITGIIYVAHDPRIRAMGSMVGGGNFLGLYSAKQALKAAQEVSKSTDPVCHVARIAPRPLLLLNVTKDQLILRPWAESLHRAAGAGAKVVWLETDHYFQDVDRTAVCAQVIDFMDAALTARRTGEK